MVSRLGKHQLHLISLQFVHDDQGILKKEDNNYRSRIELTTPKNGKICIAFLSFVSSINAIFT